MMSLARPSKVRTLNLTLLVMVAFVTTLFLQKPVLAVNLGGRGTGFSVVLGKEWKLLSKEQHDEIAKVLVAPYDPSGVYGLMADVQTAVYMGEEPKDFKQVTVMPVPYKYLPVSPHELKGLSTLNKATINAQMTEAEKGIKSSGIEVIRTGILSDGYWILGSVNNTILEEVRVRFTKKGSLVILLFAGGIDKKAESTINSLAKKVLLSPESRIIKRK